MLLEGKKERSRRTSARQFSSPSTAKWQTPLRREWVVGAAQVLVAHLLAGDGADDIGPGDVHVGGALDHEDEVGDGGRVDGAAGAGPHDDGDLGHHARGQSVAQEDIAVALEAGHTFLDAGAAASRRCR